MYTTNWQPQQIPFSKDTYIRHLGYHIDHADGLDKHQLQLAISKVRRGCTILANRYASPETKKIIIRSVIFNQVLYAAKFCCWSLETYRSLDKPIETLYRIMTKNMASFPTLLLYVPANLGGLGLPRLSDIAQQEKWQMLHRLLRADPATQAAAWYFIETAIIASSTQAPAHASTRINPTAPHSSILTSLVEWGNENSMELWKRGYLSGHSNQNQSLVIILDSLSDPLKRRLAATGCTSLADAREFINGEWKWKDPHPIIPPEQMQELVATVTNPSDSRSTLRVGQCWLIPPRIAEITGCSSDQPSSDPVVETSN
jgi:hypothetical protein